MQHKVPLWKVLLVFGSLAICAAMLYPLDRKIKPGLDLAGGTVLVYQVDVPPGRDPSTAIDQTIATLRKRVDPLEQRGLLGRKLSGDRIEIQMPAPSPETARDRRAFQALRDKVLAGDITRQAVNEAAAIKDPQARAAALQKLARDDAHKLELLKSYVSHLEELQAAAGPKDATQKALNQARKALVDLKPKAPAAQRKALEAARDKARDQAIQAALRFNAARDALDKDQAALAATAIAPAELERVLALPTQGGAEAAALGQPANPRQAALAKLEAQHPERADLLKDLAKAYARYESVKGRLEDPNDLIRMLRGSGVLEFRIAPAPAQVPDLKDYYDQLAQKGPKAGADKPFRWFQIDKPENYAQGDTPRDSQAMLKAMHQNPQAYFAQRKLIGASYGGQLYMLLDNRPGNRLTRSEPDWELSNAGVGRDEYGFPAVDFSLNATGGVLMGELTGRHVGEPMAIVLDGHVISTPNIQQRISGSGIITGGAGGFSEQELNYLVNTLRAGSLQAKLSDNPILIQQIGASFGADNLRYGMQAAFTALLVVGVFMCAYYFFFGLVADFALMANLLIVMGVMAFLSASYTLPGIAGLVLTIGMAVDANVLIYERIREELVRHADLHTGVRQGFDRAFATIIDSNLTTLITCIILGYTATADIKGFAITLGIGVVANIFTGVFCTHVLIDLYIQLFKPKSMSMLTLKLPVIHRIFTPDIDWYGKRWYFIGASTVLAVVGLFAMAERGRDFLDIEFRSGTQVTFDLKDHDTLTITQVRQRLNTAAKRLEQQLASQQQQMKQKLAQDPGAARPVSQIGAELKATQAKLAKATVQEQAGLAARIVTLEHERNLARQAAQLRQDIQLAPALAGEQCVVAPVGQYSGTLAHAFSISTLLTDPKLVSDSIKEAFRDKLETIEPIHFNEMGDPDEPAPPMPQDAVFRITEADLGSNIGLPGLTRAVDPRYDVSDYIGGVAIVLHGLTPPSSVKDITDRIRRMSNQPMYENLGFRPFQVFGLDPAAPDQYRTVVVVAHDASTNYAQNPDTFMDRGGLADTEWQLVRDAMLRDTSLGSITSFSSQISATITEQALVAIVLSWLAIAAYVWVRFGNLRYGVGAVIALIHDVIIAVGLSAAAYYVYRSPVGQALLLSDFRLNLAMIAAALTLIGYSVNDTIVVFDRIRENRGKLQFVTAQIINDSINQTLSRTILTAGTVFISVLVLYAVGGPGVHGFAFVMLIGTLVGCYSSIAVASPFLLIGMKKKIASQNAALPPVTSGTKAVPAPAK